MKLKIEKKLVFYLFFVSLGLIILGFTTYSNVKENLTQKERTSHSYQVLFLADQILSLTQNNVINSRGYIITEDSSFLTPRVNSEQLISSCVMGLKQLTRKSPTQQMRVDSLQKLIKLRKDFSRQLINTRTTQGYEAAAKMVAAGVGKKYIDETEKVVISIQEEEYRLLEQTGTIQSSDGNIFLRTFFFLLIAAFIILVVAFLTIRRHINFREKLEKQIRKMNKELANRVKEKTREVKEKERRYHFVLDNMREGAQIIGFDWQYLYINNAAKRQGKNHGGNYVGHRMWELFPGIENTEMFRSLDYCMKERVAKSMETEFIYPDGSTNYFKLSVQPIPEGLFILSMDVSERKKRERDRELYIMQLQKILFKISHELRHPIVSILGVSNLLDSPKTLTQEEVKMIVSYMKTAALTLDTHTKELSEFVSVMETNSRI